MIVRPLTKVERILAALMVACAIFGVGMLFGYHLATPDASNSVLAEESDAAKQYADKRAADKAKGDEQKGKAATSQTKVSYRNCNLDDEDYQNLIDAFRR